MARPEAEGRMGRAKSGFLPDTGAVMAQVLLAQVLLALSSVVS